MARPETGSGATSVLRHRQHAGPGGWKKWPHWWQREISSSPRSPLVQNGLDSAVGLGANRSRGLWYADSPSEESGHMQPTRFRGVALAGDAHVRKPPCAKGIAPGGNLAWIAALSQSQYGSHLGASQRRAMRRSSAAGRPSDRSTCQFGAGCAADSIKLSAVSTPRCDLGLDSTRLC